MSKKTNIILANLSKNKTHRGILTQLHSMVRVTAQSGIFIRSFRTEATFAVNLLTFFRKSKTALKSAW